MKHLNETQRYTIYRMHKNKMSQSQIAEYIGVSQATVSKELSRNRNSLGHYSPKDAQMFADMRKERLHRARSFDGSVEAFVRKMLETRQWSPEQICGYAKSQGIPIVSVERIYQYIREDRENGGKLYLHCRHRLKHRKRYVGAGVSHIPNRVSIHERPSEVESRLEFGHFEMDLIQNGKDFILTIVERSCRFLLMEKLPSGKNARDVAKTVVKLLKPYKRHVKTITTDNGGKFAMHQYVATNLGASVFFTDPYSSWQKGTVENTNKLIRQYIPKNMNISNLNNDTIANILLKINNRPRKLLQYNTPSSIFYNFVS